MSDHTRFEMVILHGHPSVVQQECGGVLGAEISGIRPCERRFPALTFQKANNHSPASDCQLSCHEYIHEYSAHESAISWASRPYYRPSSRPCAILSVNRDDIPRSPTTQRFKEMHGLVPGWLQ
jgi:hypothetical protein